MKKFSWRKFCSISMALFFLLVVLSGVILFLRPEGSLANWNGWKLLGLDKSRWELTHSFAVFFFLLLSAIHIIFNLRTIISYLKSKPGLFSLSREAVASLLILVFWGLIFFSNSFPLKVIKKWRQEFKNGKTWKLDPLPTEGVFDLKLGQIALIKKINWQEIEARIRKSGLRGINPQIDLKRAAEENKLSFAELYQILFASSTDEEKVPGQSD